MPNVFRVTVRSMRSGKQSMTVAQAERVRAAMRARIASHHGGRANALAAEIGIAQGSLSQILSGKNRPSYPVADRLAKLIGMTQPELLDGIAPASDRYPHRAIARAYAVGAGLAPEAIAEVDSMALLSATDPHPDVWLEQYRAADRRLRLFAASPDAEQKERTESRTIADRLEKIGRPKLPGRK